MEQYNAVSAEVAKMFTRRYTTSFSLGIRLLAQELRPHIEAIYGMVRLADEVVDSFDGIDRAGELNRLRRNVNEAVKHRFSANPVLQAFQITFHGHHLELAHLEAFFDSMELDLKPQHYNPELYHRYVYGSAGVIGLMCLKVFVPNTASYQELTSGAQALGAAFQKVNFLRDLVADQTMGRNYFPQLASMPISSEVRSEIIFEIESDFASAHSAIRALPKSSRRGIQLAYAYYYDLLRRLKTIEVGQIGRKRLRVPNWYKLVLFAKIWLLA